MMIVFVTGSTDGLGRATAEALLDEGHDVVVHARSGARRVALGDLTDRGAAVVVGDLAEVNQMRSVAEQVNELGSVDAVIHNAGVMGPPEVLPVNVVAPYLLTALIGAPPAADLSQHQHAPRRAAPT